MPFVVVIILLAVLGAVIGALVNWAIYQWAITMHRAISPWMKPRFDLVSAEDQEKLKQLAPRTIADRIPIAGWFRLRRDASIFGKGCWVRPLLIEVAWAIGLPLFYCWQLNGGLIGIAPAKLIAADAAVFPMLATQWFWLHTILIALMFIATFIDFDERMIPDQVTVPGTILALIAAAVFTQTRLPRIEPTASMLWDQVPIDFASPQMSSGWELTAVGLLTCVLIFTVWIWGLLPKLIPSRDFRLGIFGSIKIMFASILRPRRANQCDIRDKPRQMFPMTKLYLALWVIGLVVIVLAWTTLLGPGSKTEPRFGLHRIGGCWRLDLGHSHRGLVGARPRSNGVWRRDTDVHGRSVSRLAGLDRRFRLLDHLRSCAGGDPVCDHS